MHLILFGGRALPIPAGELKRSSCPLDVAGRKGGKKGMEKKEEGMGRRERREKGKGKSEPAQTTPEPSDRGPTGVKWPYHGVKGAPKGPYW